jgi:hypothetical protein
VIGRLFGQENKAAAIAEREFCEFGSDVRIVAEYD